MDTLVSSVAWAAGMVVQGTLLLWPMNKYQARFAATVPLWGLLGIVVAGGRGYEAAPNFYILFYFGICTLVFLGFFYQRILPRINEYVLAAWNIVFAYALLRTYGHQSPVFLWALVPTATSLLFLLSPFQPGDSVKAFLYTWYLVIVVAVGLLFFDLSNIDMFLQEAQPVSIPPLVAFMSGMAFLAIGSMLLFLIILLPIPQKGESLADVRRDFQESVDLMISKYDDHQAHPVILGAFIAILAALGIGNHLHAVIPDALFVSVLIVASPYVLMALHALTPREQSKKPRRRT